MRMETVWKGNFSGLLGMLKDGTNWALIIGKFRFLKNWSRKKNFHFHPQPPFQGGGWACQMAALIGH
jgi:hypothetical protein